MTCSEFIFRLPSGEEVGRAKDLKDFGSVLESVPVESIEYHHKNAHFAPWLLTHNHTRLSKKINKAKSQDEKLRKELVRAVKKEA
jgi:uncharacterized protein YdcH (DUF465 family)